MRMPNPDRAVVELAKLRDYCLSADHPRGRHKARVFQSVLGFTSEDAGKLRALLLDGAQTDDAMLSEADRYGQRYRADVMMVGPAGQSVERTMWIVRTAEDFPRLTSCYVL